MLVTLRSDVRETGVETVAVGDKDYGYSRTSSLWLRRTQDQAVCLFDWRSRRPEGRPNRNLDPKPTCWTGSTVTFKTMTYKSLPFEPWQVQNFTFQDEVSLRGSYPRVGWTSLDSPSWSDLPRLDSMTKVTGIKSSCTKRDYVVLTKNPNPNFKQSPWVWTPKVRYIKSRYLQELRNVIYRIRNSPVFSDPVRGTGPSRDPDQLHTFTSVLCHIVHDTDTGPHPFSLFRRTSSVTDFYLRIFWLFQTVYLSI